MKNTENTKGNAQEMATEAAEEKVFVVNKNAYRTASIEFLKVTVAYADFASKEFGEATCYYFDNIGATDEKILKDLKETTGKVFQAVISRELCSGLYKIKNYEYVSLGVRVGDAREKKADKIQ